MIVEYYGKSGWLTAESVSESDFFDSDRFTSTRTSNSETPKRLKEEKGTQKGCKPFVWRADRTPGGSQTSPRRLKLPTSPHRLKLREATSGKPGGYVWQAGEQWWGEAPKRPTDHRSDTIIRCPGAIIDRRVGRAVPP